MLFFSKQKTAYERRISDWSSDVCSSDLAQGSPGRCGHRGRCAETPPRSLCRGRSASRPTGSRSRWSPPCRPADCRNAGGRRRGGRRSEEHTSELQSLMRISYAVFCLKKKNKTTTQITKPNIMRSRAYQRHIDKTTTIYTNYRH